MKGVPVEVVPVAVEPVLRALTKLGAKAAIRTSSAKMGPTISGLYLLTTIVY